MSFDGKVVVITGAASGIGRALAAGFAKRGASLALGDVNEAGLAETRSEVEALGGKALIEKLDVADRAAFEAFRDKVLAAYGRADIIINNAGVAVADTIAESRYEDWEWIVGVNFWGVVHGTKAFLPHLLERGSGSIVNLSSVFGLVAIPTQGLYNATKFAVRGMTEALRHELEGTGIHVACVHPGGIDTRIAANARFYQGPTGLRDQNESVANFKKIARTSPEKAAEIIIQGIERNEPRILVGVDARLLDMVQRLLPKRYWSLLGRGMSARAKR